MELTELTQLLSSPKDLVEKITALAPVIPDEAVNFEPEQHKVVTDLQYRPDRNVDVATDQKNDKNEVVFREETRPVHRIPSALRKTIVDWSVNLALANGIDMDAHLREGVATDEVMLAMIQHTWQDCKMDFLAKRIEEIKQKYLTVLLVWYSVEAEEGFWAGIADNAKFKMRCTILSPEDGDTIIPIRDQFKDLIGAARLYKVKIEDKEVEKMDLFLNDKYITYAKVETGWDVEQTTPTKYGKGNFILDEQKRPEWADVSAKIERLEQIFSDTADENQLSAFPILAATGEITAAKGGGSNTRKTMQMEAGGDLKYIEANGGQERADKELQNLYKDVYMETATPSISMDTLSGTGNTPGVAIELAFLPATNKAKAKQQGSIGMFHQRNINFLKSAMAVINIGVKASVSMTIKPVFSVSLPRNTTEDYTNIVSLVGAGLMSKKTAIAQLGIVENVEDEWTAIQAEAAEAQKKAMELVKPITPPLKTG